ncbi:SMP-30/gluconolactonase/LRE family protein [Pseudoduganella violacea]|uniref:L-arabinonolactonase n=1 Tax=Pseudoduganella violacea TaxID=1715466 RepID=A0A7W5BEA3_9BURK|nr:SMP-30/gluconolactonase/LRE family protein [Pseudoduganella violacea]MBB3121543.1 L-arabinonolactonase [Pseudoduganella violacea]
MKLAVDARNALGECILWCGRSGRLLWTDILGRELWAYAPASGLLRQWPMPARLACFALTEDPQRLLLGLEHGLAWFDWASGAVAPIMPVEAELGTTRLNDGRCDRQGRFVFGTLNEASPREAIGSFYRLGPDLQLEKLPLPPVAIANSICFSPGGDTMYYCDSLCGVICCCDYGRQPANPRVFTRLNAEAGEPDGSITDAAGYLWNAEWGAARVVRYAPDGSVERTLPLPVSQPTCPAFGGPDLDTLYVSSAATGLLAPEPQAGGVFAGTPGDVRGLPEPLFVLARTWR